MVEVRPIADDELVDWVAANHVVFHSSRSAADEATFRREEHQQLARTLGAFDAKHVVATYESFTAALSLPGQTTASVDAITSVSVLPTHRRRGLLRRMMEHDLRAARERGEVAAILNATEFPIYGRFGFGQATERAEYRFETAEARFTRSAHGSVELVEPATLRTIAPDLFDRFRTTRPGQIDRSGMYWDTRLGMRHVAWFDTSRALRCGIYHGPSGETEGYLFYRVETSWVDRLPASTLELNELIALTSDAYLGLWQFCCSVDLIRHVEAGMRCVDEPVWWQLDNARAAMRQTGRGDYLWLRPLDVPRLLAARRYAAEGRLVLQVDDPVGLSGGRFVVEGGPHGATCAPSQQSADLRLGIGALGTVSLGGVSLSTLATAGWIDEQRSGALDLAERLFHWPLTPWCSTHF